MGTGNYINKDPRPDKPFINIKGDYGFKWFFGQPKRAHVLIRFLNAVFQHSGRDIKVTSVNYRDKEILPSYEMGKKIAYDVYCTSKDDEHHFVVEMQRAYKNLFEDRVLFYTSRMISEQGAAGWDYDLKPAFSIVICDFNLKNLPKHLYHDIVLYDTETSSAYSDKMNIIYINLPELPSSWEECNTEFERLCWLIDKMEIIDKDSKEYKDMEYTDFINAAQKASMSGEEYVAYSESEDSAREVRLRRERDVRDARAEGIEEGMEKGMEKGLFTKAIEIAKNLLKLKMDFSTIAESCGLSVDQVKGLAAQME